MSRTTYRVILLLLGLALIVVVVGAVLFAPSGDNSEYPAGLERVEPIDGSLNFGPGGHTRQMIDSDTADSGPQLTRFVGSVFTESGTINVTDTGWAELTGLGMAAGVIITKIGPNILRISGDNSGKYAANSRLEVPG